ncbi:MAG: hypothetical protein OHK0013_49630 [Sandaracinaceae bacterium]
MRSLTAPGFGTTVAAAWIVAAAGVCGCGGSGSDPATGSSHGARDEAPISLSLRTADGRTVALEDQRGSPVLLAVLATYDGVSQAAMRPLSRFARDHQDVLVLGILAQPDAATFAPLFEQAMASPFAITWDPSDSLTRGTSDLGPLDAVPTFIAIRPDGRIGARHVGFMSERDMEIMIESVGH